MSYILEALKKLEESRRPAGTLTLFPSEGLLPRTSRRWRPLIYLLFAALLLNGAALVWWFAPWKPDGRSLPGGRPAAREAAPGVERANTMLDEGRDGPGPGRKATSGNGDARETPRAAPKHASKPAEAPLGAKPAVANRPAVPDPAASASARQATGEETARPADLPAKSASTLPDLKLSLHYFTADPKSRFVRINDRTFHEGQTVDEGLKVVEINQSGVILSFKGARFHLGINDNR